MNEIIKSNHTYQQLVGEIAELLAAARTKVAHEVNTILVNTYWQIGKYIVEYEQNGNEKAEYGSNLLNRLSDDLTRTYGKGFGRSNIFYMRKLYLSYQNSGTLSHKLSWSHYYEILKADDPLEISFYTKECEKDILEMLERVIGKADCPFKIEDVMKEALSDKKRSGSTVNLIIPREIGCCEIVPTPIANLTSFIEAGL